RYLHHKERFRIPCRSGMCSTPMQVRSSLIASELFPVPVVKALLYPGAVEASPVADLQRLEVLAGSYFSVAGALIGILKPGRMRMFGTLLIIWGLVKEGILRKPANANPTKAVFVYPTMLIAVVCALSSVVMLRWKYLYSIPHTVHYCIVSLSDMKCAYSVQISKLTVD
ncbi:hypothetical protein POM88_013714, partial [Heracleum sosnowskyi]